jgi:hypothetical protein
MASAWMRRWTCALAAVASVGCADGHHDGGERLGAAAQGITGGTLVTSQENGTAPYHSVAYIRTNVEGAFCTATKIGQSQTVDTYITAAHCMYPYERAPAGNSLILLGNTLDSNTTVQPRSIVNLFRHPSAQSDPDTKTSAGSTQIRKSSSRSYDIAIFQVTRDASLPEIPLLPAARGPLAAFIGPGESALMVGYGCDEFDGLGGAPHSYLKQRGSVSTTDQDTSSAANYARYVRTEGIPFGCPTDSGGPLFLASGAMIGITSHRLGSGLFYSTHFGRVANVFHWINAPHSNSAAFNGFGFLQHRERRQCASLTSRAIGTQGQLFECEGYDRNIHPTLWELMPISGTSNFRIRMARTGADRCLTATAGTNVVALQSCTGGTTQHWTSVQVAVGDFLHYKIRNVSTQTFLAPTSSGALVVAAADANRNDNWLWYR